MMYSTPAIEGGNPVRKSKSQYIIFGRPLIGKEEISEIIDTLKSSWLSTGPKTKKFEQEIADYIGSKEAICVNSCTAAMHLSLVALGIDQGDEVITTPMTFASTANVIIHQRAKPVFVDIEKDSFHIDPGKIERKITKKTKAIIPVDFAGYPAKIDIINDLARKHNLYVIEDAAHAIGTILKGKKVGTRSDTTCFSFYATKNVTTGEGGAISTNNKRLAKKLRILSLHGISLGAWQRYSKKGFKHYQIIYPGYKYNLTDIASSLGIHQLKKLEESIGIRHQYAQIYQKELSVIKELILPNFPEVNGTRCVWHLYPIMIKPEMLKIDRNKLLEALHAEGIGVGIHFIAVHLHPFYRKTFGLRRGDLPNAEFVSDRILSLPLYPAMKEKEIFDTVEAINKVIKYYTR